MKANLLTVEHEQRLNEISSEIFELYHTFQANFECVDMYEQLRTIWQAIDDLLKLNYTLEKILPF